MSSSMSIPQLSQLFILKTYIYDQLKWGTTFIRAVENKTPIRSRRTNTSMENDLSELSPVIIGWERILFIHFLYLFK